MHIVLLGDSILDNGAYTSGGPDVAAHLRPLLPTGSQATLLAVDGARCDDMHAQLQHLPPGATHLLLSAGGNDALSAAGVLQQPVSSVGEAMIALSQSAHEFESRYHRLLQVLGERNLPLAVCTIYNPQFPDASLQQILVAALCHFNDVIVRAAASRGLPILDLRAVCTGPADFVSNIEPSREGGAKIARAIAEMFGSHDFSTRRAALYG